MCSVINICLLKDNSRAINMYVICSYLLFGTCFLTQKLENKNIESRAVIKFLSKDDANAKEIHLHMADVYGDSSPKFSTAEFKRGRDSLEDEPRPRRPTDVISQEMIVHAERRANDRRIKVTEHALECGISNYNQ